MTLFSSEEDLEILIEFISEALESIDDIEPLLIELEENTSQLDFVDPEVLNKIFRLFHSLKGSAGFLGLEIINNVTHAAETLLDSIRKGKNKLSCDHIDIWLELCDFLRGMFNHLKDKQSESGYEEIAVGFIKRLEEMTAGKVGACEKAVADKGGEKPGRPETAVSPDVEAAPQPVADAQEEQDLMAQLVTSDMVDQFVVEAEEALVKLESDLLALEKDPQNKDLVLSAFRCLHSLKGNSNLMGYEDLAVVCHKAENYVDKVNVGELIPEADHFSILLKVVDSIKGVVEKISQNKAPEMPNRDGLIVLMEDFLGLKELSEKPDKPASQAAEQVAKPDKKTPSNKFKSGSVPAHSGKREQESIRVDVAKLNALMDLVGEIVIAESMVSQHPDIVGKDLPGFEKVIMHLQKNIRELQDLATSIRMVPLSGTFKKMHRLVRDLAHKSGKKVELVIIGGETEMDRTVIEHISDPLVHIIRNSVDHGIEPPDEREEKGKNPIGRILLEAKQVGEEIWITIQDDGGGLNRKKILAKAKEKGLIAGSGDEMSDEEVWNLILTPGFSTADKVTDISGRGVGMDVVVREIKNIRGKVDIESKENEGASIRLKIPLTTAIIDGMLTRVNGSIYAIPILDIIESFQVNPARVVELMDGQEVIRVREKIIPVVRIHDLYNLGSEKKELKDGIIMLAGREDRSVCLFVDELIGQKPLVIKALPDYMGGVEGVSGCAILGDGNVCLILDIANIIKIAEKRH